MINELSVLEEWLRGFIEKRNGNPEGDETIFIESECMRIGNAIRMHVYHLKNDQKNVSAAIEFYQAGIKNLSDHAYAILNGSSHSAIKAKLTKEQIKMIELFLLNLNMLFDHLKDNYYGYLNFTIDVPETYKKQFSADNRQTIDNLIEKFSQRNISEELTRILEDYLNSKINFTIRSLHDMEYLKSVSSALGKLLDNDESEDFEKQITTELIYLNFNCLHFIRYYISKIQKSYDDVDSYEDELKEAILAAKEMRQEQVRPDWAFDIQAPNLKQVLSKAIDEEIYCLKKLQKNYNKRVYQPQAAAGLSRFYFKVSITIDQLIFFFRLMIETGTLIAKKKDDVYEFISRHIGTNNKDDLSKGNMRNKYSKPHPKTVLRVKSLLLDMLRILNERYLTVS